MNHTEALKAVLKLTGKTAAQVGAELGMSSNSTISMRINRKTAYLHNILEILDVCGYEIVAMPKSSLRLPEDTFVLCKEDYET